MKKTMLCAAILGGLSFAGTAQNPVLVKDIDTTRNESSAPKNLTAFNNKLYFVADSKRWNGFGMVANRELWSSNGSAEGTVMVTDLNIMGSSNSSSAPVGLKVWKNKLYFFAVTSDGKQNLYETDGTAAGTKQITTNGFFVAVPYGRQTEVFTEFDNALYFVASDWVNGYELWKTDGTDAGTVMVKEINPSKGMLDSKSDIRQLTVMGNNLYFFANETSSSDSLQIWKTNGTSAGTERIVSYKIGNTETVNSLTATSTHIYYTYNNNGTSIYKSDGTTAGTAVFLANCDPYHLTSFKGEMLFQTSTSSPRMSHICITSAEPLGYTVLKDVEANVITLSANSIYYYPMNIADNALYFTISVTGPATELWKSNGTLSGTSLIKTLTQADGYVPSQQFLKHKDDVYFITSSTSAPTKYFLNKTDGTAGGTVKLSTTGVSNVNNLTSVDKVLFFTSDDDQFGRFDEELWKFGTDTTSGGGGGTTGLFERAAARNGFRMYPNPAVNTVVLEADGREIVSAVIFDITGKQAASGQSVSGQVTIDTSTLPAGTYFCRIQTADSTSIQKLVIYK